MCDFSLQAVRSRPAKVGDKLTTRIFNLGTGGFCAPEDKGMAVCLLPGTELSFADDVRRWSRWPSPWNETVISYRTAIFRQINKDKRATHHDALEFPNGEIVLLTTLVEGQQATVLQLPAAPEKPKEEPKVTRALDWVRICARIAAANLNTSGNDRRRRVCPALLHLSHTPQSTDRHVRDVVAPGDCGQGFPLCDPG